MNLYKMKQSCSRQTWFDNEIYKLISLSDYDTPLGKNAVLENIHTNIKRNLFFNILEPISDIESKSIIRELRELRLQQIGI